MALRSIDRARLFGNHLELAATLLVVTLCVGCGDSGPTLAPVTGTVLLDGQPLATGHVITQPTAGRGATGPIQSDGTFTLSSGREQGALVGRHQVAVVAYEGGDSTSPEATQGKLLVPERYIAAETSGLTIDVIDGENAPTLELSSRK
jgi:hypothetical protein